MMMCEGVDDNNDILAICWLHNSGEIKIMNSELIK